MSEPQLIYALVNERDEIFYVGRTCRPELRYRQHKATFGPQIRMRVLQEAAGALAAGKLEREWLTTYLLQGSPLQNLQIPEISELPADARAKVIAFVAERLPELKRQLFREAVRVVMHGKPERKIGSEIGGQFKQIMSRIARKQSSDMTEEQRKQRAREAAAKRWGKALKREEKK